MSKLYSVECKPLGLDEVDIEVIADDKTEAECYVRDKYEHCAIINIYIDEVGVHGKKGIYNNC